jgi:hypothetical protein
MIPQIIITLSPQGEVQMELPGANGGRRVLPVLSIGQLRRILYAQASGERGIGTEAEPTEAALWHWQNHKKRIDDHCPFCRAEEQTRKNFMPRATATDLLKQAGLL